MREMATCRSQKSYTKLPPWCQWWLYSL
jgi:hypothetical protein